MTEVCNPIFLKYGYFDNLLNNRLLFSEKLHTFKIKLCLRNLTSDFTGNASL